MTNNKQFKLLRLKQLDSRVAKLRAIIPLSTPREGWIKQIREALGITAHQLAGKIGVSQPTLARIEKSEKERTVSLKSLDRIAEALNSKVIYAFIPRETFEKLVRQRALAVAERLVRNVSHSMELEKQGIPEKKRVAQINEIAEELAKGLSRELWENWK